MRGCILFVAGLTLGLSIQALSAQTASPNRGLVGLNHVGISVPNLDEALTYYTKTLGFPEAFRSLDEKGQPRLIYVQISRNTFVELQPGSAQAPAVINHLGIHVDNMNAAVSMFKQRGANVSEIRASPTQAVLANIIDPNNIRIELSELPAASEHRKAMERWK